MLIFVKIIFWISAILLLHTYLFYPLLVILFAINKENNREVYDDGSLPDISIIMAVRNEEKIISQKIESIVTGNYPQHKITFYIGSDASDDNTNKIIEKYAEKHKNIKFLHFTKRSGKVVIINKLFNLTDSKILVFTDANAILAPDALKELVKHFKNSKIKIVGGRLVNKKTSKKGVAFQEHSYMELEYRLKLSEGKLWGSMMGAYGAFLAIRADNFTPVPHNFMADDFFISLKAVENDGLAICEPKAVAYENVAGKLSEEFRRKSRISTGNFQNLKFFLKNISKFRISTIFSFISHKMLRWLGFVFIFNITACLAILAPTNIIYLFMAIALALSLFMLIIDFFCRKNQIQILPLRFITHFYYMNAALFVGFIKYLKGVKNNVWEPTKRE